MTPLSQRVSSDNQEPAPTERSRSQDAKPGGLFSRLRGIVYDGIIAPLVFSKNPPRFDARGISLGLIIGLIIPLGGHIACLTLLRMLIRFNYLASLGSSLIGNPFNAIPLYYGYYCLGSWLMGSPVELDFTVFSTLMNPITDAASFWDSLSSFMHLGREMLVRWFAGAVALAVVFGPLGYVVTCKIQQIRCKRAAEKMGLAYEHFLENLEKGHLN